MIKMACGTKGVGYGAQGIPNGADYFKVTLKHVPEYAMSVHGKLYIVVDSGASQCLFRRIGMSYKV